jgi:hypothetical protein
MAGASEWVTINQILKRAFIRLKTQEILGYFSGIAAANTSDFIWFNGQGHWLYGLLLREVDDLEGIR